MVLPTTPTCDGPRHTGTTPRGGSVQHRSQHQAREMWWVPERNAVTAASNGVVQVGWRLVRQQQHKRTARTSQVMRQGQQRQRRQAKRWGGMWLLGSSSTRGGRVVVSSTWRTMACVLRLEGGPSEWATGGEWGGSSVVAGWSSAIGLTRSVIDR